MNKGSQGEHGVCCIPGQDVDEHGRVKSCKNRTEGLEICAEDVNFGALILPAWNGLDKFGNLVEDTISQLRLQPRVRTRYHGDRFVGVIDFVKLTLGRKIAFCFCQVLAKHLIILPSFHKDIEVGSGPGHPLEILESKTS